MRTLRTLRCRAPRRVAGRRRLAAAEPSKVYWEEIEAPEAPAAVAAAEAFLGSWSDDDGTGRGMRFPHVRLPDALPALTRAAERHPTLRGTVFHRFCGVGMVAPQPFRRRVAAPPRLPRGYSAAARDDAGDRQSETGFDGSRGVGMLAASS